MGMPSGIPVVFVRSMTQKKNDGQFKPGESGNPSGRPKGAKNQITLLKESLELALRTQSEPRMGEILDKAMELALQGDRTMLKLLIELHMSKGTTQDQGKAVEKVQININGPQKEDLSKEPDVGVEDESPIHVN
jgi:hypothetical protein